MFVTQTCLGVMSMLLSVPTPKTPVTFEGACQAWSRLAHGGMLVMDYAGHARGACQSCSRGMPVMLAG
jgi:hypothetical protein